MTDLCKQTLLVEKEYVALVGQMGMVVALKGISNLTIEERYDYFSRLVEEPTDE